MKEIASKDKNWIEFFKLLSTFPKKIYEDYNKSIIGFYQYMQNKKIDRQTKIKIIFDYQMWCCFEKKLYILENQKDYDWIISISENEKSSFYSGCEFRKWGKGWLANPPWLDYWMDEEMQFIIPNEKVYEEVCDVMPYLKIDKRVINNNMPISLSEVYEERKNQRIFYHKIAKHAFRQTQIM